MSVTRIALLLLLSFASPAVADVGRVSSETTTALERWPALPEALASFGATSDASWMYVYGGHVGQVHAHSRDNLTGAFLRLNLRDLTTWEALPSATPLQGLALVIHRGAPIRVGGLSARNAAGEEEDLWSVAEVARFDPLHRRWQDLPALPEARSSHDAAIIGDTLFVVGGWMLAGERQVWLDTAWSLDLAAERPTWRALPKPPFERRAIALAVADGKLLVLGGMDPEGELSRRVDLYDPATRAWSRGPDLPFDGFGCAAIGIERDVLASGLRSDVWRLGLQGDELAWERLRSLSFPRYFHRLVALGPDRLLAVGGSGAAGHARVCEPLDLADTPRPLRAALFELPLPGRAKNRQAVQLHRDALWVAGGNSSLEQHDFSKERFLDEGWRIDLGALRVEPAGGLPAPRQTLATAFLPGAKPDEDAALAVGGFVNPGDGARSTTQVSRLSFATRRWDALPLELPGPRTQLGLARDAQGRVWVLGGVDYDARRPRGEGFRFPREVLRLDAAATAFEVVGELPRVRRAFGCAVLDGKAYLVGGMRDGFELVPEVDVLDLATGTWSQVAAPRRPRVSPELVAFRGKLWLAGGSSPPRPDSKPGEVEEDPSLDVFDPATGRWTTVLERLPVPTRHASLLAWRDRLVLYSAHVEGAQVARIVVLDPAASAAAAPAMPASAPRSLLETVRARHDELESELTYLAGEHGDWERDVKGKPAAWREALAAHARVVERHREVVKRHASLVREAEGLDAKDASARAALETRQAALLAEAHELHEEHEELEATLEH